MILALAVAASSSTVSVAQLQASLTFPVNDYVGWKGGRAVPGGATEVYRYDPASDTVSVEVTFDASGFAALPPMLALAYQYGFPIEFNQPIQDTGFRSVFGPLMGVENSTGYTYSIRGLGRYVLDEREFGAGEVPADLQAELEAEVEQILQAGHLAPWFLYPKAPRSSGKGLETGVGYPHWFYAGEQLYFLSEVAPLLPEELRARLIAYLRQERASYPPDQVRSMPFTEGAPRQVVPQSADGLRSIEENLIAYMFSGEPILWQLYGLARYYALTGEAPSPLVMASATETVQRELVYRDWATLYWQMGHTPHFNAVHGVNQMFAGFVGYIRLARLAGDASAEALGWGMLARMAVLRYAMGKYTQYEYDAGRFVLPPDPAWWAEEKDGCWRGELITFDWSRPIDNVRQVHLLDDHGVETWEWMSAVDWSKDGDLGTNDGQKVHGVQYACSYQVDVENNISYWYGKRLPYQLIFADMVPELGRFLADYLKPESETFVRRVVENQPHWYVAYLEGYLGSEDSNVSAPADSYHQFVARAWILNESPQELEGYVDVPWLPLGDFYYLHKLAETIKAYRGVSWR